jgi:hypothetical protein
MMDLYSLTSLRANAASGVRGEHYIRGEVGGDGYSSLDHVCLPDDLCYRLLWHDIDFSNQRQNDPNFFVDAPEDLDVARSEWASCRSKLDSGLPGRLCFHLRDIQHTEPESLVLRQLK